ncbi:MAG: hypothetical protein A2735_00095 [Candidatus Yanofskybacteria bacterium RIFCSPHIGHO2_01_FULL_41_21]|uniref:DOD-type homing endonuclease domain-containing protein n=2 Tax=Candidatus Yanofskyibacteriota TaxID=1752733 RepID=A0A0G0WKT5_9BACT|nr:MAG: hypothetical protein UU70_C0037G0003 [Candidatus Yanofskybacteria bacterium GW2011_GWA1_41_6]OGM98100.1 MAG: hypothetical protein A2735_00095 [Candidatus Yanofskybacteria bacterium RIFCSPHIGHO2_01_FULL_41_21]
MSYYRTLPISDDKNLRAYIIGLAIGDGNLSNPNGRATRLRITCDKKYPDLIKRISRSLQLLLPKNRIGVYDRKTCADVMVYSNQLENILGWKVGLGSKYTQNVSTPKWIFDNKDHRINYLKGLIETDGSIYLDRGYKMVIFSTINLQLANEVKQLITSLGFTPKLYTIKPPINSKWNQKVKYHIRLSKDVQKFLDLVKPNKS